MMASVYSGAGIAFFTQLFGYGIGYISNVLFARWMGPTEYGIFAYVSTWALLLASIGGLEFPTAVLRFIPEYTAREDWQRLRGITSRSRVLVLVAGLTLASLGFVVALVVGTNKYFSYISAFAVGVWMIPLWALVYLHTGMFRALKRLALAYVPPRVIKPILLIIFAFLFVSSGRSLTGSTLIAGSLGSLALVLLFQLYLFRKHLPGQVSSTSPSYETREWLQVSGGVLLVTVAFVLLKQINLVLIGIFLKPDQVGLYSAATKTTELIQMPSIAMAALSVPLFSSLYVQKDQQSLQELVSKVVTWSFWPSLAGATLLILLSHFFLGLFGPKFGAAQPAVVILAIGGVIIAGAGPVLILMQVTGHQREAAFTIGYSAVVGFILGVCGIYAFGITGAALASVVTAALWVTWLNIMAVKKLGIYPSVLYVISRNGLARSFLR